MKLFLMTGINLSSLQSHLNRRLNPQSVTFLEIHWSAIYARDLSIGAVSKLQEVIVSIANEQFAPDAPRSGYKGSSSSQEHCNVVEQEAVVKTEDEQVEEPLEGAEPGIAVIGESECSGSSDGSDSAEDSSSGEEGAPPPPKKCSRHFAAGPLEARFVMHRVSHLIHYLDSAVASDKDSKVISCGRTLNQNYKQVAEFETVAMCRRCKTNAVKDGHLPKQVLP